MIVLDTNVVSEPFRIGPDPRVLAWVEAITDDVALTTITLAELLAGARRLPEGRRRSDLVSAIEDATRPYRDTRSLLAFDEDAADAYADIVAVRMASGRPISMADAQIAAICRVHDATLATRNTGDFEGTGVALVNPWED